MLKGVDYVKVNRGNFLEALEFAKVGLAQREIIQQSTCFIFKDGLITTYNEKTACRCPSPLGEDFAGAVQSTPLIEILGRLPEDDIGVGIEKGRFLLKGNGRRRSGINMEAEIFLQVDAIETPADSDWKPLPEEFGRAVSTTQHCAGEQEGDFALTCIHITPDWVEACDMVRVCFCRWNVKTGFSESVLLKRESIRNLENLGTEEFAETNGWIHFRNQNKWILSCRRYSETNEFPSLDKNLEIEGEEVKFSPGLPEELERAQVFVSPDGEDNDFVRIDLFTGPKGGRMRLRGQGPTGFYEVERGATYQGEPLTFFIPPLLLLDVVKKEDARISVTPDFLVVQTGDYHFVAGLAKSSDDKVEE